MAKESPSGCKARFWSKNIRTVSNAIINHLVLKNPAWNAVDNAILVWCQQSLPPFWSLDTAKILQEILQQSFALSKKKL